MVFGGFKRVARWNGLRCELKTVQTPQFLLEPVSCLLFCLPLLFSLAKKTSQKQQSQSDYVIVNQKQTVNHTGPNPPSEALGASLCSFTMWYRCHIFVATGKNILQEPHNPTAVYSWITVDISTPGWAMMIALLVVIWLIQWLAYTASSKIVAKHVLGPM